MPGGGGGGVLSLGFEFESTVDKRAPLGWAGADKIEKIVVGGGTIVRHVAK